MNSLQSELHRLYHLPPADVPGAGGRVRAMVLEVVAPPSWRVLGKVWQGVQEVLGLPAPGIAVSGTDGLQLWFSLAEAVSEAQALGFLEALQSRFLSDIASSRVRLIIGQGAQVPGLQEETGNWSAFVAPDLAPVFDDTPWLDVEPNEEGQTSLLRALRTTPPAAFAAALQSLGPPPTALSDAPRTDSQSLSAGLAEPDPRRFLQRVMNDDTVSLALRIEAAKALLPKT